MPPVAIADLEPTTQHVTPGLSGVKVDAHPTSNASTHKQAVMERYKQEAAKRVRPPHVAMSQYLDPAVSARHAKFAADPWIDLKNPPIHPQVTAGSHSKILIIGAGFGGIFYAVEALKTGFALEDIRIVDPAGGFGGTWYWNRGPGLMCDVESYIYLPYLEEMGYMPKERYSSGEEIRQYVNGIAKRYKLFDITYFGTSVKSMRWNEDSREWQLSVTQADWKDAAGTKLDIRADFVCHASGILHRPKLPAIPGLEDFEGPQFHTARWDYNTTGGEPGDPRMDKLADKRVAVVGTGATAIQAVPRLAQCAKHLYVVQRTPSAVAVRGQRPTDPAIFQKEIAEGPGWQLRRQENFMDCTTGVSPPPVDLVNDGWTDFRASVVMVGSPDDKHEREAGSIPALIDRMNDIDLPRQDRIRARVDSIVKDQKTAEGLKAWYPGWCKRPCFHDEYLSAFNEPNVTLVDTNGQSIEAAIRDGIVVNGKEYPVDVLVWSTGFNANGTVGDPATRGAMDIIGRNGRSLSDMWAQETPRTLHSVISGGFPNLFFISSLQGGASIVFTYHMQQMAVHAAYIMKTTLARAKGSSGVDGNSKKVAVEPTPEAIDAWELAILQSGGALKSAMAGCTPGYYNMEGLADQMPPEIRMKKAKIMPWGKGMSDLRRVLEEWRDDGSLKGLELR